MPADGFKCKYCGKFFLSTKGFKMHKLEMHKEEMMSRIGSSPRQSPPQESQSRSPTSEESSSPEPDPPTKRNTRSSVRAAAAPAEQNKSRPLSKNDASKTPSSKEKAAKNKRNMPLPIGKKRKVVAKDGSENEEWIRNPKFAGA